jgi:hypothetical protein
MDVPTADELQEARQPLASLLGKSEKAQQKLASGTWQHTMPRDNIKALRIALALMNEEPPDTGISREPTCRRLSARSLR